MNYALLTMGWIVWGFVMKRLGWEQGVQIGSEVTIQELEKQSIIMIDPATDEILPSTKPRVNTIKKRK